MSLELQVAALKAALEGYEAWASQAPLSSLEQEEAPAAQAALEVALRGFAQVVLAPSDEASWAQALALVERDEPLWREAGALVLGAQAGPYAQAGLVARLAQVGGAGREPEHPELALRVGLALLSLADEPGLGQYLGLLTPRLALRGLALWAGDQLRGPLKRPSWAGAEAASMLLATWAALGQEGDALAEAGACSALALVGQAWQVGPVALQVLRRRADEPEAAWTASCALWALCHHVYSPAIDPLVALLESPEHRELAARALWGAGLEAALAIKAWSASVDRDQVQGRLALAEGLRALARVEHAEAAQQLRVWAADPDPYLRHLAWHGLGARQDEALLTLLMPAACGSDALDRDEARHVLARGCPDPRVDEALREWIRQCDDPWERQELEQWLSERAA